MVFLAVLLIFFLLKHQNLGIQWQKSVSFWGRSPPDPLPGLCPWTPLGDFRPLDPLGPLLSHILNTPLFVANPLYTLFTLSIHRTRCTEHYNTRCPEISDTFQISWFKIVVNTWQIFFYKMWNILGDGHTELLNYTVSKCTNFETV